MVTHAVPCRHRTHVRWEDGFQAKHPWSETWTTRVRSGFDLRVANAQMQHPRRAAMANREHSRGRDMCSSIRETDQAAHGR